MSSREGWPMASGPQVPVVGSRNGALYARYGAEANVRKGSRLVAVASSGLRASWVKAVIPDPRNTWSKSKKFGKADRLWGAVARSGYISQMRGHC